MDRNEPKDISPLSSHPIERILSSRQPSMLLLKYTLLLTLVALGLVSLGFSAQSLVPPLVYRKDFIQEYLLARAVIENADPYLSLPELAEQFIGPPHGLVLPHPTPHPPPVAVISLPLALLTYEQAAVVWFLFEIVCIFVAVYWLLRWSDKRPTLANTALVTLCLLGWRHSVKELVVGQLMSLLLVLMLGAWWALRSQKEIRGGVLLGSMIALKLVAWPIVIFLAVQKRWRAVVAAGIVVVTANLAAALLMGSDRVIHYYSQVSSIVAPLYQGHESNFSVSSIGWRFFEGTGSPIMGGVKAPPIIHAPVLAKYLSYIMPVVLLIVGLMLSAKARSLDASFGILVCVSILINPVAWSHYLLLTLVPIVIAGRYLVALNFPKKETYIALALGMLLIISSDELHDIAVLLGGQDTKAVFPTVLFTVGLITLVVPLGAVLGLLGLVWRLDCVSHNAQ